MNYRQNNLTSDVGLVGINKNNSNNNSFGIINPWAGFYSQSRKAFIVVDNGNNRIGFYDKTGNFVDNDLNVTTVGPTGLIINYQNYPFLVNNVKAEFLICTQSGAIEAYSSSKPDLSDNKTQVVFAQKPTNSYTGMDVLNGNIYAANFKTGNIDVIDVNYKLVLSFTDVELTRTGYAPYNVYAKSGKLYVSFAKQDALKTDVVHGTGNGYIDVFDRNGILINRLVNRGHLNAPWGMLSVDLMFNGQKRKLLLVGNTGDGRLAVYDRKVGTLLNFLRDKYNNQIVIDGIHALIAIPEPLINTRVSVHSIHGNNTQNTEYSGEYIFFTAGINSQSNGLFGVMKKVDVSSSSSKSNSQNSRASSGKCQRKLY